MRAAAPKVACPICWGKGKWPAISDRNWFGRGATRTCDYIQSCPYCCGTGEVKASLPPAKPGPSDMAAAGGLPPLSAPDDPLNPIPKGET